MSDMQNTEEKVRIIQLHVQDVLRLKAVRIEPKGNTSIIGGQNAQGKSSLLNSIQYALGGAKDIPVKAIREGAEKGLIEVQLSNGLVVRRSITPAGGQLVIMSAENSKIRYNSPQSILDEIYSKQAFDPLDFIRQDPKKQAETLKQLAGIDYSKLDEDRKIAYSDRADVNRDIKRLEANLAESVFHDDVPAEEVSLAELKAELDQANETARDNQSKRFETRRAVDEMEQLKTRVEKLKAELIQAESDLQTACSKADDLVNEASSLIDPDVSDLTERIGSIEETNRKIRENQKYLNFKDDLDKCLNAKDQLDKQITGIDAEKKAMLLEAALPIDDLMVYEDGVRYRGIPLQQASSAEQLKVGMAVGLALNPKSGLILIRDGSLLDSDSLEAIQQIAEEHDAQVFIERVGEGSECQVIIEDGEAREV